MRLCPLTAWNAYLHALRTPAQRRASGRRHLNNQISPFGGKPLSIVLIHDRGFRYGAGMGVYRQAQSFLWAGHQVTLIGSSLDADWHNSTDFSILKSFPGTWRGILSMPMLPALEEHPQNAGPIEQIFLSLVTALKNLSADVVVLGNLHGANWPIEWVGRLQELFPQVVVYAHDIFYMSGRCAYPGACERYMTGCDAECPTPTQYPALAPHLIRSAWETRSRLFDRVGGVPIATASTWFTSLGRRRYPSAPIIRTLHYGLDELNYAPMNRSLAKRLLGFQPSDTVVTTGAIDASEYRKGGDLLIPLIEALSKRSNVKILVFGLIGPLQAKLAAFPQVRCVGLMPSENMPSLLSASDVFVGMSREEGLGQTFMEAAACGVPVVAFDVGGIGDVARTGETAVLSRSITLDALLEAIFSLLDDPVRHKTLGRRARAFISENFTLEAQARRWNAFLADCSSNLGHRQ